jgi:hypothetical protein
MVACLRALALLSVAGLLLSVTPTERVRAEGTPSRSRPCWVFFREPDALRSPRTPIALSARAAIRLEKVGRIAGSDRSDFAFDPSLLDPIRERGLIPRIRRLSRWLQAVSLLLSPEEARDLASDRRIRLIHPVARFIRDLPPEPPSAPIEEGPVPPASQKASAAVDRDPRTLTPAEYGPTWDQLEMIGIPEMHRRGLSGSGVMVALFDSGFFKEHASLSSLTKVAERDFVRGDDNTEYNANDPGDTRESNVHGTYTWSALGGYDPGRQIGGAYRASFVLAKTEDVLREVHAEEDNYIAALEWADSLGVDIVSTSLGYRYFDDGSGYSFGELNGETAPITIATERAAENGILVITAMGNDGPEPGSLGVPADGKRVVSVGAVDSRRVLADFSSRGPTADGRIKPDVDAQGIGVFCASASGILNYTRVNGTSLSTPLAASLATLLLEARPDWGPDSLIAALRASGDHSSSPDNNVGWGVADGLRALRSTDARLSVPRYAWIDENRTIDGVPGFDETGALRLWIRNLGARPSGAGEVFVGLHSPLFSLIDSTAVALPPLAPMDSALVTIGRMEIGEGQSVGLYPLFVRIAADGDTVDRKLSLTVIPSYSIAGVQATAGSFGTIHVTWRTAGEAITRARVYRSAAPDTSREIVFEESVHRNQEEWIDRPTRPGRYRYWVSATLIGGRESAPQGPAEVVTSSPSRVRVGDPFPNPVSSGSASIPLAWTAGGVPRIEVYDVTGRRVRELIGADSGPGFPLLSWDLVGEDGRPVATGWYFVRAPGAGSARLLVVR